MDRIRFEVLAFVIVAAVAQPQIVPQFVHEGARLLIDITNTTGPSTECNDEIAGPTAECGVATAVVAGDATGAQADLAA
jgi:hypothetical protein